MAPCPYPDSLILPSLSGTQNAQALTPCSSKLWVFLEMPQGTYARLEESSRSEKLLFYLFFFF